MKCAVCFNGELGNEVRGTESCNKLFVGTMVDTGRDNNNTAAGKSILKRRIFVRNDKTPQESATTAKLVQDDGGCCLANACKRYVTFDETISVKNEKDLVVRKPLKLKIVIDNWKPSGAETPPETVVQSDPGIVRRLVDEFNTIGEPLTNSSEFESALVEKDKVKEDEPVEIRTNISLCEALETKATAVKLTDGKLSFHSRSQSSGRINNLINMFNLKPTNEKTEDFQIKFIDF